MTAAALSELERQIVSVGSFSSITLALLAIFTNQRYTSWAQRSAAPVLTFAQAVLAVALDCALCAFTIAVLAVLAPLACDAADAASWFTSGSTLESLLVVVWCGLAVLVVFQLWIAYKRYKTTNWSEKRAVAKTVSRR